MARWLRFEHGGQVRIGTLDGERIAVHDGELFDDPKPSGEQLELSAVRLLAPVRPGKILALWNNFAERAQKEGLSAPQHPLYFTKHPSTVIADGEPIRRPADYEGRVVYEGELGVVIGRTCSGVSEEAAPEFVFGYTLVNDVTASELLHADASFVHWTRAKSFDTFCPMGPVIATGLNPLELSLRTVVNGRERQNYPVTDMFFTPHRLVSLVSHDTTLEPGDVIACGTSLGAMPMRPGTTVEVVVDGIGTLTNRFD